MLINNYVSLRDFYPPSPPGMILSKERSSSATNKYIVTEVSDSVDSVKVGNVVNVFKNSVNPVYSEDGSKYYVARVSDIVSIDEEE